MIRYVQGDILLSKAELLAHGVAPNDDFHQGLALPRLATGAGALDWGQIKPLFETHLGDVDATVDVYDTHIRAQAG